MEIKCLISPRISPPRSMHNRNQLFSPSDSGLVLGSNQNLNVDTHKRQCARRNYTVQNKGDLLKRYDHISSTKSSVTHNSKNTHKFVVSSRTAHRLKPDQIDDKQKNLISEEKHRLSNRSSAVARKDYNTPNKLTKINKIPFRLMKIQQSADRSESKSIEYDRPIVSHNIFMKNDNYYYSDEVKLTKIFQKFYYENFKQEDLKEYILPAFRKVNGAQNYFEILFAEAKNFGYSVRDSLIEKIRKLVLSKLDNNNEKRDNSNNLSFKRFGPNCKSYTKAIATLHEHYKLVENVNFEIEKLTRQYLENFLEKRKNKISFDSFLFHKRMFINCVYNEPVIHSFVVSVVSFFKQNNFYAQNFQASYLQVMEIFENLEQLSQTLVQKYVNNTSTSNINQQSVSEQENVPNNSNTNSNQSSNKESNLSNLKQAQQKLQQNHQDSNKNHNNTKSSNTVPEATKKVTKNIVLTPEEELRLEAARKEEKKEKRKRKKKLKKEKLEEDEEVVIQPRIQPKKQKPITEKTAFVDESSGDDADMNRLKKVFKAVKAPINQTSFCQKEKEKLLFSRPKVEDF